MATKMCYCLFAVVVTLALVAGSKVSENGVKCFKCLDETRCPNVERIFDLVDDNLFSRDTNEPLPACTEVSLTTTERACVMCRNGSEHYIGCFSVTEIEVEGQGDILNVSEISCDHLKTMTKGPYGSSDDALSTASSAQSDHCNVCACGTLGYVLCMTMALYIFSLLK